LFVRISQKIKSITQPFVFCGRLRYLEHDKNTSKPVHIIFQSIDFEEFTENEELKSIYRWKPSFIGKSSNSNISKKGQISNQRLNNFKKPNKTERKGLITSRVGQGYYRQQIIEKWGGRCPITGINIQSILIASHIVPWSESSDDERLDVENGILLSPSYDALFDKHLISFENDGNIIISTKVSLDNKNKIGLSPEIKIQVTDGMSPYLERHRKKLRYKEHLK
jgi:predicted restriction endonuclease